MNKNENKKKNKKVPLTLTLTLTLTLDLLSLRVLWIVLEEVRCQPLYWVRRPLLDEGAHAVEEEGHDCLVEVGSDGEGLEVELVLCGL